MIRSYSADLTPEERLAKLAALVAKVILRKQREAQQRKDGPVKDEPQRP